MSKQRKVKQAGVGNTDLMSAMLGKRGSSAAGPHKDRRDRRVRTRAARTERAMKDYQ